MTNENRRYPGPPAHAGRRSLLSDRLLWLCTTIGVIAAATVLFLFGWSFWTVIVVAILIACPTVIAVVLNIQLGFRSSKSRGEHAQV